MSIFAGAFAGLALAAPAWAHGDHDARPLARDLEAGPYRVSLWQVYPDFGAAITPHLIVLFDAGVPASAAVSVELNSVPVEVLPSTTTKNGWETTVGVTDWDIVTVTISDAGQAWRLESLIVRPAPTSILPMRELVAVAIALTAAATLWAAARTARAWRRPIVSSSFGGEG